MPVLSFLDPGRANADARMVGASMPGSRQRFQTRVADGRPITPTARERARSRRSRRCTVRCEGATNGSNLLASCRLMERRDTILSRRHPTNADLKANDHEYGREQVTIDEEAAEIAKKVPCPHADHS